MERLEYDENKFVEDEIEKCSIQDHIQQVAYSTYHSALTQVCFSCGHVRTTIKEEIE